MRWNGIPSSTVWIAVSASNTHSIRPIRRALTWLKSVSRRQFGDAVGTPRANWVPVDFCSGGARVAVGFFLALVEFGCADEGAVAFDFGGVFVGVGFLLAALTEEPEDYAEEGEGEGDADCATDDEAEVGF